MKIEQTLKEVIKNAAFQVVLPLVLPLGLSLGLTLASVLTPAGAVFAVERESNGWIYCDMEDCGLRVAFPSAWKKTLIGSQKTEPDNVLKVSGALNAAGTSWAELAVSNANKDVSSSLLLKMLEEGYWSKLPDFKGSAEKKVSLRGATDAVEKELTFRHSDTPFSQRFLYFKVGQKPFTITLTCPLNDYQASASVWNSIIGSVGPTSAAPSSGVNRAHGTGAGSASTSLGSGTTGGEHSWRSKDGHLAFSYPAALKETVVEGEHLLNAASNQNGKIVSLDVYRGDAPPNMGLAEITSMVEDKYFVTQKNYQKVAEEPKEIGFGNGVSGIVRESTHENDGVKIHQMSGFLTIDKYYYAISLSAAGCNSNEAHQIWTRLVSSISAK